MSARRGCRLWTWARACSRGFATIERTASCKIAASPLREGLTSVWRTGSWISRVRARECVFHRTVAK